MKLKIFLTFFICSLFLQAQDFKKTATAGFVFLEIPVTARSAALGDASIALPDLNSDAVFSNPAVLGFNKNTFNGATSYSSWIADTKHSALSASYATPIGVFGLGIDYLDYGTMPRTIKTSSRDVYIEDGTFGASDIAIGLSFSQKLTDKFSFGVTGKYVREAIDSYSASNFLFDGGVLYYTGFSSLRIAATIQNFGVNTKFRNEEFVMPSVLKLGLAMEVFETADAEYRLTAIAEALHPRDADERLIAGLEASWRNTVTIRGGYKFFYDEETYSFGVGINPNLSVPVSADFSYSDYGRLGNFLRFTLQLGIL